MPFVNIISIDLEQEFLYLDYGNISIYFANVAVAESWAKIFINLSLQFTYLLGIYDSYNASKHLSIILIIAIISFDMGQ